ncbi:MAG: hypothetical protein QF570_17675 [Myxococcota bacterium]|jgi:hypothetical protein|nr:hypothetical protein [Myxococcota bacterium]
MSKKLSFPSSEWFEAVASRMTQDLAAYRELGSTDCAMVVKTQDGAGTTQFYEVVFESFGVKSVRSLTSLDEAVPEHFVLESSLDVWCEMVENIQANGAADLEHTLNYLTFPDDPMLVSGPDQLEIDAFYRYNESLQRFFDGSSDVATTFS